MSHATSNYLVGISRWVDQANAHRDEEAQIWGRVAKVGEENGEVLAALIGWLGANPRKNVTHSKQDVIDELLDVAVAALGAVEHLTGNQGEALDRLADKIAVVHQRTGR